MKITAIIVAGGKGLRMGAEMPKQFMCLGERPVLMHTIEQFANYKIILVLPHDHINHWQQLCREYNFTVPHTVVTGGQERYHSVKNALDRVDPHTDIVLVHDGVRPLVDSLTIDRVIKAAEATGAAAPGIRLTDTLRYVGQSQRYRIQPDREEYRAMQTPQGFAYSLLFRAYAKPYAAAYTDDATIVEMTTGHKIAVVEGERENIKLTTPVDCELAELILKRREQPVHANKG